FAARMSLSFPLLLSAVRLRTPDFTRKRVATGRYELRRVWFSDGGLTSNFPIHFFDSPLPSRPTFCLNLVDFDTGIDVARQPPDNDVEGAEEFDRAELADKPIAAAADPRRKAQARPKAEALRSGATEYNVWDYVSLPRDNRIRAIPFTDFERTGGVGGFLAALVNTARFWSDNQLLISPGVRERVVDIALRDDEGGLNIDMHPDVVAELDGRGQAAGKLIAARFDPAAATDPETGEAIRRAFPNHRWVRYRNLMSAFEDFGRRFVLARRRSDAAAARRGELSIAAMIDGQTRADAPIGYPAPAAARNFFKSQTRAVTEMLLAMAEATRKDATQTFDADERNGAAPRPKIRLRLRPLVNNDPRVESVAPPAREDAAAAPRPSA
ncbi:MAG: hypothetical protein JNK46_02455, partial [Methylobacteriaceae bacterium]|nr:hypothetical protein [Methylobacteriaceae bacterium]